jgi:hypothetical protein
MDTYANTEEPVFLLGDVVLHGATKFSVRNEEEEDEVSFSVCHVTFRGDKCFVRCMDGSCAAQFHNKSKIPRIFSLCETKKVCTHLKTFYQNLDKIQALFPEYFQAEDGEEDAAEDGEEDVEDEPEEPDDMPNREDGNLSKNLKGIFNLEEGLWTYPAVSTHKPKEMLDPHLIM